MNMDVTINQDASAGGRATSKGSKPLLVRLADGYKSHSLANRLFRTRFRRFDAS
jgi:hypothetical protein